MSANLKSEGTTAEQIDLGSQGSKGKLLRMRQYQRQPFLFVVIELGILIPVFILLYFLGFRSFSEIETALNPKSNLYNFIIGLAIVDSALAIIFFYTPPVMARYLLKELHLNRTLYLKAFGSLILLVISLLFLSVYLFLFSDSIMFFIITLGMLFAFSFSSLIKTNKLIKQLLPGTQI